MRLNRLDLLTWYRTSGDYMELFTVTMDWLNSCKTARGGYQVSQVAVLCPGGMVKGWKTGCIGMQITQEQKTAFEGAAISRTQGKKRANEYLKAQGHPRARFSKKEKKRLRASTVIPPQHGPVVIREVYHIPMPPPSGVNPSSAEFLDTYEWRRVRMVALKQYGPVCQCCGATPANGSVMHVDHIKPRKLFPQLALDVNNLQILCHECNHGKGNWDMTDWRTEPEDHETDLDREAARHLRSI